MARVRPLIGITPGFAGPSPSRDFARTSHVYYCDTQYTRCITETGGIPVLLTHLEDAQELEQTLDRVEGILLTGGEDVNPLNYADVSQFPQFPVAEERDRFEFDLVKATLKSGKPLLAICRGHQVLNVALGGSLIQDIPVATGSFHHVQGTPPPGTAHDVELVEGSRLARLYGLSRIRVNSYHHQAIKQVAPSLTVVGLSEEGIIEAVESSSHVFAVGVQWHPERLAHAGSLHRRLFEAFVTACSQ
jgi:putative glutamine amidotransferase